MSNIELNTNEALASYGIGLQMGQQLASIFEGVSLNAALEGIKDAFEGNQIKVTGEAINEAFGVIQAQMQEQKQAQAAELAKEGDSFLQENAKREGVVVLDSGLQYEVIEQGGGEVPKESSVVSTHYRGTLVNGKQFDSSYDRGEPAQFPVGGVIAGWTEALQLMPVGSKWRLYIPHHLAYGEAGAGADIGPYQALIFDIELLDIVA